MPFLVHCYDLLIRNATVVDPGSHIHKKMDIGIYEPNIGDLFEPGTMPGKVCARKVIDASGMYAVPGLIEGHGHVLPLSFGFDVDGLWRRGITAICDMGSVSISSFHRARREIINPAPCVINAALCITNTMESTLYYPLFTNLDNEINKEEIRDFFAIHGDVLMGIKVFIGAETPTPELVHAVMRKSREVCDEVGCPMIVHVANPCVKLPEIINYFRPGDNFTHAYNKGNILDEHGHVYREAFLAKERGVLFDSARGARNWSAEVARAAFAEGFTPNIISADLTCLSNDPNTSRLTVHMSECMSLGMSFEDVLYHATNVPARYMKGVSVGLHKGGRANITLLEQVPGPQRFVDAYGVETVGECRLEPRATILNGVIMYNELPMAD